jgi:C4-dicarboxylate-specific signal transduction histidine kinase
MSGLGAQLAPRKATETLPGGRNPLAHLLHALNQPLTGLQCSLELAVSGPRRTEEYVRTLREGLELTERMRILVEALRELTDIQPHPKQLETFQFDGLLRDTVDDLIPVADALGVELLLMSSIPFPVKADRRCLAGLIFRFIDSALALTQKGSDLQILVTPEPEQVCFVVSWNPGPAPEHSPFSRQELGLLIAQAGFERAGAEWTSAEQKSLRSCTVRLPVTAPDAVRQSERSGGNPAS